MQALIFDLDGTLVDTVYAHVFAWQLALAEGGMPIDGWRVHRRIGMSGGPLPGAIALLRHLREAGVPHGIATSGHRPEIDASLAALEVPEGTVVVDRGEVERAKPEPDLFLACQKRLGVSAEDCYAVGDSVWDLLAARRARMLGVGLLTGGYGQDELQAAGAYCVYRDAAELDASLDELGLLP
jgi:HAD superfamily hydrolase (TIGR01509 family)